MKISEPFVESHDRSFQLHTVFNLDNDNRAEDTPTLIDRKVNFVKMIIHYTYFSG